jgi:hypothetical protein
MKNGPALDSRGEEQTIRTMTTVLRKRRTRRWAIGAALGVVFGSSVATLIALALTRVAPSWWRSVRRDDPEVLALGQQVENSVVNRIYKNRADGAPPSGSWHSDPWTIEVSAPQANAWLNARLPKWIANQAEEFRWPKDVTEVQVQFEISRIVVGAKVKAGDRTQVVTATLEPRLERDGRLFMPATWVNVGRLAIPADWILDHARRNAGDYLPRDLKGLPETDLAFRAFAGEQAVRTSTLINLGDGRSVRILAIEPRDGSLLLTCQTELE